MSDDKKQKDQKELSAQDLEQVSAGVRFTIEGESTKIDQHDTTPIENFNNSTTTVPPKK